MKVNGVNQKENSTIEVIVEIPAAAFEKALDEAYKKAKRNIMVPGFRRGKAPRKMIERMYGGSVFYEDAINIIAPDTFAKAAEEKEIKAVGMPSVSDVDVSDDKVLTLTFLTAVYPEVTLGAYKGLSAEKAVESVKKKEVDAELETMQNRNARTSSVKRKAKKGDIAAIDFEGFLDGVPFEGGKGEGHELNLGSGSFVPGFEEQVIGMKAGDEKDVNITFPEDYAPELAGKEAVFKVKCVDVKERIVPELDDEFAKDVSEFDTLEAYKKDIKARLTKEREARAEDQFKEAVMKLAVENMTADVPTAMVDRTLDNMMQDFFYTVSAQGMDPAQYLQMMGMDVNGFREASRTNALARVQTGLLLDAVAEAEGILAAEEEVEAEFAKLAEQHGKELEEIKKVIRAEDLTEDIRRRKATEVIHGSAKAEKPAAKKAEAADEETEEKAPVKKASAAKKTATADKPAAKKAASTKKATTADETKTEKAPAKKAATAKKTTAADKPAAKKAAADKPAVKKTTAKKPAVKKTEE